MVDRLLTLEEFTEVGCANQPTYGNFHLHFMNVGMLAECYRETEHYRRFDQENNIFASKSLKK